MLEKQEERELGWGGFDDVAPPNRTTVVLKAAFHPSDFAEDIELREDLESDIAEECEKMGACRALRDCGLCVSTPTRSLQPPYSCTCMI